MADQMMIMNHLKLLSSNTVVPVESDEKLADVHVHVPVHIHVRAPVHAAYIALPIEGINDSNSLPSSEKDRAILRPEILDSVPKTTIKNGGKHAGMKHCLVMM